MFLLLLKCYNSCFQNIDNQQKYGIIVIVLKQFFIAKNTSGLK